MKETAKPGGPGIRRSATAACLIVLMSMTACQESLPPYHVPSNVFSLVLRADQPDLDAVQRDLDDISMGKGGLGFSMDLRNTFDETLADTTREPLGGLQIWWRGDPSVTITLSLNRSDEIMTHMIRWDGFLILNPGDSMRMADVCRFWVDDRGTEVWAYAGSAEVSDNEVSYAPMDMAAQAWLQPFEQAPAVYSNIVKFRIFFSQKRERE